MSKTLKIKTDTPTMPDSVLLYLMLAMSGGSMDAYSYLCRDYVFANAQTGNLLLLGIGLAEQNFPQAMKYFLPITAFVTGIILSNIISHKIKNTNIHWKQISLIIKMVILLLVCFISDKHNEIANALISLVCGIQAETFRSVHGNAIATTMCIGNLRSGISHFNKFIYTKKQEYIISGMIYFGIITFFVVGAVIESYLIKILSLKALGFSVVMLILAYMFIFFKQRT